MRQASSGPTRAFLLKGSTTPPIQISMLLGVWYRAISLLARFRFLRTVPSSPTVLGTGSPQKRLQALYPVWEVQRVVVGGSQKAHPPNTVRLHTEVHVGKEEAKRLLPIYKPPGNPLASPGA